MVDGESMSPTLEHGDALVVARLPAGPGDVVVAQLPDGTPVVKRIHTLRGGDVHLMGDNPASAAYVVGTRAVLGKQVLPALPTHRFFHPEDSSQAVGDSALRSYYGRVAFRRGGWYWIGDPTGKAKRAVRGESAAWSGSRLAVVADGQWVLDDPALDRSTTLGTLAERHAFDRARNCVAFEDRGFVWTVDAQLTSRPLCCGRLLGVAGDHLGALQITSSRVEVRDYDTGANKESLDFGASRRLTRSAGELDLLALAAEGVARLTGGADWADLREYLDGDLGTPVRGSADLGPTDAITRAVVAFSRPVTLTAYECVGVGGGRVRVPDANGNFVFPEAMVAPLAFGYRVELLSPRPITALRLGIRRGTVCQEIRLYGPLPGLPVRAASPEYRSLFPGPQSGTASLGFPRHGSGDYGRSSGSLTGPPVS